MTEYAAYFGDSGHPDDQVAVVVAGFIAREDQWLIFQEEWSQILSREGIGIFHMADFEHSRSRPQHKKDAILRRLVKTIQTRTERAISHITLMEDYKEINRQYPFEECVGTPYALAGRTIAASLNRWKRDRMQSEDKLLVFFEDGTKHKGDFKDAMERDQLLCPTFKKKVEAVPLQAADWLAWEILNVTRTNQVRPSFEKIIKTLPSDDPFMGIYTLENLEKMCQEFPGGSLPPRSALSPDAHIAYHSSPKKPRKRSIE